MSKWLPPLLVPIPKGHACHYATNTPHSWPSQGKSSSAILQMLLQRQGRKAASLFVDLPQPDTYYRLFARRTEDKKQKYKKPKIEYLMFKPTGEYIGKNFTLKEAKRHLAMDEVTFIKTHKKVEVPIGSYVLKYIEAREEFNWERPTIHNLAPVAVKRCKECPNKTSTQGICACGFFSAIRDNTESKVWWPIHDRRMYDIRHEKTKNKKIKISIMDLFED
jgi:hypothetical protein